MLQVTLTGAGAGQTVIALYDLTGRLVFRQVVASAETDLARLIAVGSLPRSPYLLLVTAPNKVLSQRILLK
jgi:hypothetical protein